MQFTAMKEGRKSQKIIGKKITHKYLGKRTLNNEGTISTLNWCTVAGQMEIQTQGKLKLLHCRKFLLRSCVLKERCCCCTVVSSCCAVVFEPNLLLLTGVKSFFVAVSVEGKVILLLWREQLLLSCC